MVGKDRKDKQGQHSGLRRLRRSRIFESDSDNGRSDSPTAQPPETFAAPPEAAGHRNSIPAEYSTEDDLIQTSFPPTIADCMPTLGKQQQILEQQYTDANEMMTFPTERAKIANPTGTTCYLAS